MWHSHVCSILDLPALPLPAWPPPHFHGQLNPQPIVPVGHSEKGLPCSKKVNLAIRWPLRWMSATLQFQGFTPMSAALPPGSMVGTRTGSHLRVNPTHLKSQVW